MPVTIRKKPAERHDEATRALGDVTLLPPPDVTPPVVRAMAALMATKREMASYFGMNYDAFRRKLRMEAPLARAFVTGRAQGKLSLRAMQYKSAQAGSVLMQMWLGKNHLGQSERFQFSVDDRDDDGDDVDTIDVVPLRITPELEGTLAALKARYLPEPEGDDGEVAA